jgi:hypothetical protein
VIAGSIGDAMKLSIGYFALASDRGALPAHIGATTGEFADSAHAILAAKAVSDQLGAQSFIIDFPDGTSKQYTRDGARWKVTDA